MKETNIKKPLLHFNHDYTKTLPRTSEIIFATQGKCVNILLDWTRSITLSFRWAEAAGGVPMRQYLIRS
jgi:hypothetical protein